MNVSLYQAASAMTANARWQEVVSENLAAANIPGYKKQELSFAAIEAGNLATAAGPARLAIPQASSAINFEPGVARFTGVNTDVAIDGAGFFEVQLPSGLSGYTRDGEFQIDSQGQLVTKQGCVVLGEAGPIMLDRNSSAPLSISSTGDVSQGTELRGKIRVVNFQDPRLLTQTGSGFFLAENPALQREELFQPSVRSGFLEGANTTAVMEMANLIRVMRGFEASQRLVQAQDERMGRAISELGNPN